DLIIFCDGCDISVCQSCYLVDKVPEGEWFCRPCAAGARVKARKLDASCALCCQPGGALEPTMCGKWAHTFCCQTFEEVFFVTLPGGKAVASLAKLFPERKDYACALCPQKGGSCILCPRGNCKQAFHSYCAR
ncbi:PHD-zinc-finger like domain-containing protein, partial [Pavlovales sp. CCMP2436]